MKRAALYCRVSTVDQHPETQLHDLRQFAANKGFTVVGEYTDHGYCGARARRPQLDRMMDDARRHKFDVLLVWACDRLARSTKHLLQTIDELNGMGIQFLSQREAIDTEGPLGRAILVIVSAMAELERCIIIERVRAGMRRARLEGRQIGRSRLDVNRQQVINDRRSGMSLTQVAKKHGISRASVCRLTKEASSNPDGTVPMPAVTTPLQATRRALPNEQQGFRTGRRNLPCPWFHAQCLICEGVFTPTEAAEHAFTACCPAPKSSQQQRSGVDYIHAFLHLR
jgi:DNA invertase Pin-like site-specific DNA recombinase